MKGFHTIPLNELVFQSHLGSITTAKDNEDLEHFI